MNRLAVAGTMLSFAMLSTAAVAPALAADLGRPAPAYKAPPPPPPPLFSWTGCYIGVSGGWLDDHKRFDRNADTVLTTVGNLVLPQTITSTSTKNSSGLVGGTVGCNYQFSPWGVVGIEGDWSWTGSKTSFTEAFPAITALSARTETITSETNWLATIRGRIGALVTPNFLLYVTGGGAFANDKSTFGLVTVFNSQFTGSDTKTLSGGVVGAGGEWAFGNWSFKAEYLYVALGSHSFASPVILQNGGPPTNFAGGNWLTNVTSHHENIFRVGLNYRFGGYGGPLVARY